MQQVVIFVRILNKEHEYERQVEDLRAVAQSQAVQVVAEIIEEVSDTRKNQPRKGIEPLLELCRQGAIQKVLVSEAPQIGRTKIEFLRIAQELTRLGINIYIHNLGIETLKNGELTLEAQLLFGVLAQFINLDRENILLNLEVARQRGKAIGRPAGITEERTAFLKKYTAVASQLQQGLSVRKTAVICEVAINTVRKVKALL